MSRSGYTDDCDDDQAWIYLGHLNSAINGKRGQAALRELAEALDAMPEKRLGAESLVTSDGEFCTLGVLGNARGIDMVKIDPEDWDAVANAFDIAPAMAREIMYKNDETVPGHDYVLIDIFGPPRYGYSRRESFAVERPADMVSSDRWRLMRNWVGDRLKEQK